LINIGTYAILSALYVMPFGETNYGNVAENVGGQREETSDLKPSRKPYSVVPLVIHGDAASILSKLFYGK
jgi:hypothetical protein